MDVPWLGSILVGLRNSAQDNQVDYNQQHHIPRHLVVIREKPATFSTRHRIVSVVDFRLSDAMRSRRTAQPPTSKFAPTTAIFHRCARRKKQHKKAKKP